MTRTIPNCITSGGTLPLRAGLDAYMGTIALLQTLAHLRLAQLMVEQYADVTLGYVAAVATGQE